LFYFARMQPQATSSKDASGDSSTAVKQNEVHAPLLSALRIPAIEKCADCGNVARNSIYRQWKKPRTIARERHSLVHWKKSLGYLRLNRIQRKLMRNFSLQAFFTKQAFRPTAIPSILQEIS